MVFELNLTEFEFFEMGRENDARVILKRIHSVLFLMWNILFCIFLPRIKSKRFSDAIIEPFSMRYFGQLNHFHRQYSGVPVSKRTELILKFVGNRTCFLVVNQSGKLIGFYYCYFYFRDLIQRVIHCGLVYIDAEYRGRGYGNLLERSAQDWWKARSVLRGTSLRVKSENIIGLKMATKKFGNSVINFGKPNEEGWISVIRFFSDLAR